MSPEDLRAWTALNLLAGLGPILVRRALERWGDPAEIAFRLPPHAFCSLSGFGPAHEQDLREGRKGLERRVERELKRCRKQGVRLLAWGAPDYPAALEPLPDAPILLYALGDLPAAVVRVAVVGSRRATSYGTKIAIGLGGRLAERGIEVVSGGARGIDTHAHIGALEAEGRTVAVVGSGLGRPYPPENERLFRRIAAQGAVISEFPLEAGPKPEHFPRRNRIISALAAAVVVVEAAERSGSLITATHAAEQGREVLAVPGPVTSERSVGCHRLIQQGAKLVQNVEDIIEELSPMYSVAVSAEPGEAPRMDPYEGATPDEAELLGLLDRAEPVHLDDLADGAPFGIARLQTALFGLEVRGAVDSLPGGYYRRADR